MERATLARALYNNTPEAKNELLFRKGDILTVIEIDHDMQPGWWLCTLRGQRGICPGNYLELIEDKYTIPHSPMRTTAPKENPGSHFTKDSDSQSALDALETYDVPRSYRNPAASSSLGSEDPLDMYDIPRSARLQQHPEQPEPTYVNTSSLSRTNSHQSELSLHSTGSSTHLSSASSSSSSARSSASSDPRLAPDCPDIFRKPPSSGPKRSAVQSDSTMLSTAGQELYDVPRSAPTSRAQSALSMSSGYLHSESKDSLDHPDIANSENASRAQSSMSASSGFISSGQSSSGYLPPTITNPNSNDCQDLYDVPRNSGKVLAYVTQFETKYDQLNSQNLPDKIGEENENTKNYPDENSLGANNNNSSNFSSNGSYRRKISEPSGAVSGTRNESKLSLNNYPDDLYDVPRSARPAVVVRNHAKSNSLASIPPISNNDKNSASPARSLVDVRRRGFIENPADKVPSPTRTLSFQEPLNHRSSIDDGATKHRRATISRGNSVSSGNGISFFDEIGDVKILPLNPRAAVTVCEKLRQEVMTSVKSILDFSLKSHWRDRKHLEDIMPDLRFSCVRLNLAVKDMTDFCSRTVSNARTFTIEALVMKLQRLLNPLINASQIIQRDIDELEAYFWSVERLSRPVDSSGRSSSSDALDQLVLCARSVQHDATEIANFIALNSSAFFLDQERLNAASTADVVEKGASPDAQTDQNGGSEGCNDDYDYVSLLPRDEVDAPADCTENSSEILTPSNQLALSDEQLLEFYSTQIASICPLLSDSISKFISSVQNNDPPKTFNGHLKYVILLAYKMLFAGDTVHRNIIDETIREQVESKANDLHKSIVSLHEASRVAARDFPRIPPMQGIVDRVWETTAAATQLKKVILQAACL